MGILSSPAYAKNIQDLENRSIPPKCGDLCFVEDISKLYAWKGDTTSGWNGDTVVQHVNPQPIEQGAWVRLN